MLRVSLPPVGGDPALAVVARALAAGGLAVVPTDTLYGLSARADRPSALRRLADLKGRDDPEPFLVLVTGPGDLPALTPSIPPRAALHLVWPGPVTLILAAQPGLPAFIRSPRGTVAVRWPADPALIDLIRRVGAPIVSTSVNRHGEPPLEDPDAIQARFGAEIDVLADAGRSAPRVPSTIVDLTRRPPALVRAGAVRVDLARLAAALGGAG